MELIKIPGSSAWTNASMWRIDGFDWLVASIIGNREGQLALCSAERACLRLYQFHQSILHNTPTASRYQFFDNINIHSALATSGEVVESFCNEFQTGGMIPSPSGYRLITE